MNTGKNEKAVLDATYSAGDKVTVKGSRTVWTIQWEVTDRPGTYVLARTTNLDADRRRDRRVVRSGSVAAALLTKVVL